MKTANFLLLLHKILTKMLKFISFGSGSSGNCYMLATPTDALLIDIGVGLRSLKKDFRDYGLSMSQVHHVLVTHDHADHIKSVGSFCNDYQVPVYTTAQVHDGINHNYCIQQKVVPALRHKKKKGVRVQIGDFFITPFSVPHDSSDNVGYMIEAEGVVFCMITDAGYVTDEMKTYISKANYLVIEANHDEEMVQNGPYPQFLKDRILSQTGHLSNRSCGLALVENMTEQLRYVWLCHLSEENNHPELARKTVESLLRDYGIIVGVDVKMEVLKRTTPTGIYELV